MHTPSNPYVAVTYHRRVHRSLHTSGSKKCVCTNPRAHHFLYRLKSDRQLPARTCGVVNDRRPAAEGRAGRHLARGAHQAQDAAQRGRAGRQDVVRPARRALLLAWHGAKRCRDWLILYAVSTGHSTAAQPCSAAGCETFWQAKQPCWRTSWSERPAAAEPGGRVGCTCASTAWLCCHL